MQVGLIAFESPGTHFTESDAGAVIGIDIGGDFEDETRELRFLGHYKSFFSLSGTWTGGDLYETIQLFLNAKVVQRATKEHGSHLGSAIGFNIKLGINTFHEFQIFAQFGSIGLANIMG